MKVVKSASKYAQTALDEIHLLRHIQQRHLASRAQGTPDHPGRKHVVEFLDCFALHPSRDVAVPLDWRESASSSSSGGSFSSFSGSGSGSSSEGSLGSSYGSGPRHVCMTFEPLGESLLSLLRRLQTIDSTNLKIGIRPLPLVQQIARQILLGLDFLHAECGLIHTDLKLENVLVVVEDVEELVRASEGWEAVCGVSPTRASRRVAMSPRVSRERPQPPHIQIPRNQQLGKNGLPVGTNSLVGSVSTPLDVEITGSYPLPSPMHGWGRENAGPEVSSLAVIMAQLAREREEAAAASADDEESDDEEEYDEDEEDDEDDEEQDVPQTALPPSLPTPTASTLAPSQPQFGSTSLTSSVNSSSSGTIFSLSASSSSTTDSGSGSGSGSGSSTGGSGTTPTSLAGSVANVGAALSLTSTSTNAAPKEGNRGASPSDLMLTSFSFDTREIVNIHSTAANTQDAPTKKPAQKKRLSSNSDLTLLADDDVAVVPPGLGFVRTVNGHGHGLLSATAPSTTTTTTTVSSSTPVAAPSAVPSTESITAPSARGRRLIDSSPKRKTSKSKKSKSSKSSAPLEPPRPTPPRIRIKIADLGQRDARVQALYA